MRNYGGPTSWGHFAQVNIARQKFKQDRKNNVLKGYAVRMRENPTPLETILYNLLFELKIPYSTQEIIGRYIVDAAISGHEIKKVIEADGFYHESFKQRKDDARRDKHLKHLGYDVLHIRRHEFYNHDLLKQRISDFVFTQAKPGPHKPDSKTLDERFEGSQKQTHSGRSKV